MSLQITKSVLPKRSCALLACNDTSAYKLPLIEYYSKSAHNIVSESVFNALSIDASHVLRNYPCAARFLYKVKVMIFYVFLSSDMVGCIAIDRRPPARPYCAQYAS